MIGVVWRTDRTIVRERPQDQARGCVDGAPSRIRRRRWTHGIGL